MSKVHAERVDEVEGEHPSRGLSGIAQIDSREGDEACMVVDGDERGGGLTDGQQPADAIR